MARPDDLDFEENWNRGFYELAFQMGPRDDARLAAGLARLWQAAGAEGPYRREYQPISYEPVDLSLEALETYGHLLGTVRLPNGTRVVCGALATRFDDGDDWLELYLPMGALAETDQRIGAFPFEWPRGSSSLEWRLPLDQWLADIAAQVYLQVPFELGLIGGAYRAEDLPSGPPAERDIGFLVTGRRQADVLGGELQRPRRDRR
jgi:hypothetical protein